MSRPDATTHIRTLARRLADSYLRHSAAEAILLVGSAATGCADQYSDLDLLVYHAERPAETALARARREIGAEGFQGTPWPDEGGFSERYSIGGLDCQIGHAAIPAWEREIARVLGLELDAALLKEMSGLFEGLPLHGEDLIERWRREAAYTAPLQRAMIEKHWSFFPWWYFEERLRARDATVWRYDVLVQSAYNIVGIVAALNAVYFCTFEFKRATAFLSRLALAPPDLATRLDALFEPAEPAATAELERLVGDTRALVSEHLPEVDVSLEWGGRPTPPGSRELPWM